MLSLISNPLVLVHGTRSADEDPLADYNFIIEIGKFARAGFMSCSALDVSYETIEYREGGNQATKRKRPGLASYPDITLERGIIIGTGQGKADLALWLNEIFDATSNTPKRAKKFRREIDRVVKDDNGVNTERYRLMQCWPSKATISGALDATKSGNLVESMTIAYEGFKKITPA